ncbi:hypothetical protein H106_02338 [Trichophyton rubrum CBS 735.88]|nr:hypothetical protein H106_02338 [Trichophyton rubrum CBS 735.88]
MRGWDVVEGIPRPEALGDAFAVLDKGRMHCKRSANHMVTLWRQHLPLQIPVQLSATYLLKTSTAELARQHIDIFAEVDETRDVARTRTVSSDFPRLCAENSYFTQSTHTPIPVPCHHLSANMTLQQASVEQEWYRVFKPELDTAAPDPIDPVNGIMKEFSLKRT